MIHVNWQGITPEKFLQQYWQKQHLFLKNAVSGLGDLIDGNDLAGLSEDEQVESRLVYQKPENQYHLVHGPFTEEDYLQYGQSHWTLLVQAVNHYLPELSQLLAHFKFIPQWLLDDVMVSYATPQGGVGAHYDQYDVFLIQASGTRDWHIGQYCDESTVLIPNSKVKLLKDFQVQHTFHCEPGDMLYLPTNLSHNGIATSDNCITYSVGSRAPSWRFMLERLSDQYIEKTDANELFKHKNNSLQAMGTFDPTPLLAEIKQRLNNYLDSEEAKAQLCAAMSEPKYYGYQPADDNEYYDFSIDDLSDDTIIQRDEASRFLFTESPQLFYINGESYPVHEASWPLIQLICNQFYYHYGELKHLLNTGASMQLFTDLITNNYLRIEV